MAGGFSLLSILSNSFASYLYKYTILLSPLDKYWFMYYYMYTFKYLFKEASRVDTNTLPKRPQTQAHPIGFYAAVSGSPDWLPRRLVLSMWQRSL